MPKINLEPEKKNKFNLKEFFKKHKFIWIFALLVALVAGFFGWYNIENFSVSMVLTISRLGTQETVDYKYDNYYALKASDEFGSTVVGWFKTPEIASAINRQAGAKSAKSFGSLSQQFKAAKISPNLVEVRYGAQSQTSARQLALAIERVISDKVEQISLSSQSEVSFILIPGEPVIVKNSYDFLLNILAGFLIGLIFGFFAQVAKEYFYQ